MNESKARKKFQEINREIYSVEKLIWAYTGAKKCSYAPLGLRKFKSDLHELGLQVHRGFVSLINWPTRSHFDKIEKEHYSEHKVLVATPHLVRGFARTLRVEPVGETRQ
jgi:hypothetical protein